MGTKSENKKNEIKYWGTKLKEQKQANDLKNQENEYHI
jgi:hypothetical protein